MGFCRWSLGQASQLDPSSIKYVRPAFVCARMGPVVNRLHNAPSQLSTFYGELAPGILRNLQCSRLPSWHSWHLLVFPHSFSLHRYLGSSSIKHSMWRHSQPLYCSNCELEAIKGKLKLQQQEMAALRESNAQLEKSLQDNEMKRDKELVIILRKANCHSKQIRVLRGIREGKLGHTQCQAMAPSTGS